MKKPPRQKFDLEFIYKVIEQRGYTRLKNVISFADAIKKNLKKARLPRKN